jgi:hypothetical protein
MKINEIHLFVYTQILILFRMNIPIVAYRGFPNLIKAVA